MTDQSDKKKVKICAASTDAAVDYNGLEEIVNDGVFRVKLFTSFDELDPLNMLHNSRYQYILERATYMFFNAVKVIEEFDIVKYPDLHHVVYNINLSYLKPIFGVRPFIVTIAPQKLREAGAVYDVAFLSEDGNTVYCKGSRTIAKVKPVTFEPVGWTPKFRLTHEYLIDLIKKSESKNKNN